VIDLSRYLFEALWKDEEFILYRGRSKDDASQAALASCSRDDLSDEALAQSEALAESGRLRQAMARPGSLEIQSAGCRVLVLSPLAEYPAPEILKWLEHAYSLREQLDSTWAAQPIALARHWDRTVLVSEDPGGAPLDQLLGQPLA
jgi:hypothetical protein